MLMYLLDEKCSKKRHGAGDARKRKTTCAGFEVKHANVSLD